MRKLRIISTLCIVLATCLFAAHAHAQIRQNIPAQTGLPLTPIQPLTVGPTSGIAPSVGAFDPYATVPNGAAANTPPTLYGQPGMYTQPGVVGQPIYTGQPAGGVVQPYGQGVLGAPQPIPGAYPPQSPGSLFPQAQWPQGGIMQGGLFQGGGGWWNGTNVRTGLGTNIAAAAAPLRFIYGPRIRHAWLPGGDDKDELDINDTDVSIVATWPNFLFSNQPLYILPSFSLHLWDGPQFLPTSDLPSRAYSAFLDLGWTSDPLQPVGVELGGRIGIFSDFNSVTVDSLRLLGKILGTVRINETVQVKAGVMYVDRLNVKLIPAGGILWTPNPDTRFDIFFPKPQLAQRVTTFGNDDLWWYIGGEFGGGSWTVERVSGASDQVDMNDIRLFLGFEWGPGDMIRSGQRIAFIEAGWVLDREVKYRNSADNFTLNDTVMVRAGLGY